MEVFEAALAEAKARWNTAHVARLEQAGLSKQADARGDETGRTEHWRNATRLQNEMIKYADAITALSKIVGE